MVSTRDLRKLRMRRFFSGTTDESTAVWNFHPRTSFWNDPAVNRAVAIFLRCPTRARVERATFVNELLTSMRRKSDAAIG